MSAPRFFIFLLALALIGFGIVWIIRYFFGGKALETKGKMEQKVLEDELDALDNIKEGYKKIHKRRKR